VGVLILAPTVGRAQGNSVLVGTVTDANSHAPLEHVLVTAFSPALQGEQQVLTDATGEYRVPQLPPGTYTLRFEREDHQPFAREGIDLPPGFTLRFNPELFPQSGGEISVVVTGRPPVVDLGSTQQGAVVKQDFIRNIALAPPQGISGNGRSFEAVALVVPTARADQYGIALNGTTSPENSYLIDGLSTRNPNYGISGSPLSVEFVDSVTVVTGGYLPEYGRNTGGIIQANTHSGGNEFHGSIWGTWTPGALAGNPHPIQLPSTSFQFREVPHNIVDFGATLGGSLIKDRLWFFVGIQPEFTRYREYRDLRPYEVDAQGNQIMDAHGRPIAGPVVYTTSNFADEHQIQYFGKLTFLVSDDHRISLSVSGTPSHSGGPDTFPFNPLARGQSSAGGVGAPEVLFGRQYDNSFDAILKLSSSFASKSILLDVTAGWHHEDHDMAPGDGSKLGSTDPNASANQPRILWGKRSLTEFETLPPDVAATCLADQHGGINSCPVTWYSGGPGLIENRKSDSLQLRAVLTFLFQALGHHLLKLGVDGEVTTLDRVWGFSGGAELREASTGGPIIDQVRTGFLTGPDQETDTPVIHSQAKSVLLGGFVQDSWSVVDRVTLNAGVRFDTQTLYGTGNDLVALSFPHEWSPRVGLVWDFTQQGRSKIYASYARYFENVPLDLAEESFGRIPYANAAYLPASGSCTPQSALTAGCATKDRLIPGAYLGIPPNPSWYFYSTGQREPVDPNTVPPSEDEVVAGLEYEILPRTRASFAFTHRNIVDWVEDMSFNGSNYFIGNPGWGLGSTFPRVNRIYNSFVVALDKSYSDLWLLKLSYTYQNLNGNIDGLFRAQTGQIDPNINSDFDIARLEVNRQGPLAGDIRHTVKAYVAKEFVLAVPFSVAVGVSYVGSSGPPIDFLGANVVNGYGSGEVFIFPRGANGRLGWLHTIDLSTGITYRFSASTALTFSVNVFNLFNFQQVTRVSPNYTVWPNGVNPVPNGNPATDKNKIVSDTTGEPLDPSKINPNFLRPVEYQAVRQVRFQARVSF
jgi:outer membrane receptor protein involved in Fe transport